MGIPLPSVKKIIGVISGKGGVGKSSISSAIAQTLKGNVGLLDADIYGPSIPRIFNLENLGKPEIDNKGFMLPLKNFNVSCMSMGFLAGKSATMWRGMMVMKGIQDMIWKTNWGNLDYLIIDFPPGTGDAQMTIFQQLKIDSCVVVSTPQVLSIIDAEKGIQMLEKMNIPISALVKNMSVVNCHSCHTLQPLFPDPKHPIWTKYNTVVVPFDHKVSLNVDNGIPIMQNASKEFSVKINDICTAIDSTQ